MKKIVVLAIFIIFVTSSCFAEDETLELTTYYPAPYGDYNKLSIDQTYAPDSTYPFSINTGWAIMSLNGLTSNSGTGGAGIRLERDYNTKWHIYNHYNSTLSDTDDMQDQLRIVREGGGWLTMLKNGTICINSFPSSLPDYTLGVAGKINANGANLVGGNTTLGSTTIDVNVGLLPPTYDYPLKINSAWAGVKINGTVSTAPAFIHFAREGTIKWRLSSMSNDNFVIWSADNDGIVIDQDGHIFQTIDGASGGEITGADYIFEPTYKLESIENHAKYMWDQKHLPAVQPFLKDKDGKYVRNLTKERDGMLEELEKAHIFIEQLNKRLEVVEARLPEKE